MKYSEARLGRIFILRLEDGEIVHQEIEKFARKQSIHSAVVTIIGGTDKDSKLVTGPQHRRQFPTMPIEHVLENVHECEGVGTLFPDENGEPILHMHMACGRRSSSVTGCIRPGVKVWQIMEVVLFELTDCAALRAHDPNTGFKLLKI